MNDIVASSVEILRLQDGDVLLLSVDDTQQGIRVEDLERLQRQWQSVIAETGLKVRLMIQSAVVSAQVVRHMETTDAPPYETTALLPKPRQRN